MLEMLLIKLESTEIQIYCQLFHYKLNSCRLTSIVFGFRSLHAFNFNQKLLPKKKKNFNQKPWLKFLPKGTHIIAAYAHDAKNKLTFKRVKLDVAILNLAASISS